MLNIVHLLKVISVLTASILMGNWFLSEVNKARAKGDPWYTPYFSPPGLLILAALSLPIIIRIIDR